MRKISQATSGAPKWSMSTPSRARPPTDRLVEKANEVKDCIDTLVVSLDAVHEELDDCRQRLSAAQAAEHNPAVLRHLNNACENAERWLIDQRDKLHTATALQDELVSIQRSHDAYANALDRNLEDEDRSLLHQGYVRATQELDTWSATWARFQSGLNGPVETPVVPPHEATEALPGVDAMPDRLGLEFKPLPWDFFQSPFPSHEQGQIEHVVGMQAQLHALDSHLQALQKRCDQLKLAHTQSSPQEREAIKADYAATLKALLDGKVRWSAMNNAYFKAVAENLHRLHFDAFDELLPVALVMQDIRTATSGPNAMAVVQRYLADLEKLKAQLKLHGAQPDLHQHLFDLHATMVQIVFLGHMSYIDAIHAITLTQEAFPLEARLPLRCPWDTTPRAEIKRGAEVRLEQSKSRTTQSDVKSMSRQQIRSLGIVQQRSAAIGVHFQHKEVGFDGIVADLKQIQHQRDKEELTRYTLDLIGKIQQKRWLLTSADAIVELFKRIDATYKAIEKTPDPSPAERDHGQEPVRRAHTGRKTDRRPHKAPETRARNRTDERPATNRPHLHDRHQAPDDADVPDLPTTTEVSAEDLLASDWQTAGAPAAWTHYVSQPDGVETTLRATNRTLESRASNIRNWNQHDMAGNESQALSERDCLALIDWVAWSSREQLPDGQKLFNHYTILCGPGTGNFAGQMQLKIVNNDPTVPAVVTHEFDQLQRRMKRPTFHMRVDVDADGLARIREALALRGFPPAIE